jgi:anti-sigma regulatory factor (Ser/Thr protein kinase)
MLIKQWAGSTVSPEALVEIVGYIQSSFPKVDIAITRDIYRVLAELITNVKHHAYPEDFKNTEGTDWKVIVSENELGIISLIVEDKGITIPRSVLRKLYSFHKSSQLGRKMMADDSLVIDEAINQREVDKKLVGGRGKGLLSITKLVDISRFNSLHIRSRNGVLNYYGTNKAIDLELQKTPLDGTSVEVRIATMKPTA